MKRKFQLGHERRVFLVTLAGGSPGVVVALVLLWSGTASAKVCWTLSALIICVWLGCAFAVRARIVRPLQTISNLLAALGEGDYSFRARGANEPDALGEVMREVNALGANMREQRLGAMEATALLRTVMAEIDVAVFAFDRDERLRLVNRAGERLLAQPAARLIGRTAQELGLIECLRMVENTGNGSNGSGAQAAKNKAMTVSLDSSAPRALQKVFPGSAGGANRWGVRRSSFRQHGAPHHLLVLSDLSGLLREEEKQAWQRLVRVLGHELNNSLAPIKSIAGSLSNLLGREPRPADWQTDMKQGLTVVSSRAESLSRFMESYARLARLPPPRRAPVKISALVRRVAGLETRVRVEVEPGADISVHADADQLEQLLINLVRNAAEAALVTGGGVRIGWNVNASYLEVWIEDEGLGLANTANLFVPFFTTKPNGSGIGLVLSRQIAEAHGGALTLENRRTGTGCEARLRLPL